VSRSVVDPAFAATLREIRKQRGVSLRRLEKPAYSSRSQLQRLESGNLQPTAEQARQLDEALDAGGRLVALVTQVDIEIDQDRLAYVARHPRRADATALGDLETLLAAQRRLDDVLGSSAVVGPAEAQLVIIDAIVGDARGDFRPRVLEVAAQWAQFAGWLHAATGERGKALDAFSDALEWATETGDRDMIATVLSFKGYLAEGAGRIGSMIGLSAAAQRDPLVYAGQRAYSAGQEARARAIAGEEQAAISKISEAAELATLRKPTKPPPWIYYYTPGFFEIQRGIVLYHLGADRPHRNAQAIELLTAGLKGLDEDARRAEWAGVYICLLAEAHARAGNVDQATKLLNEARVVAATAHSAKVSRRVAGLARKYGLSPGCP
jgi:transcriptional regulator with XRE-family HTH domain